MKKLFNDGLEIVVFRDVKMLKDEENRTVWASSTAIQKMFDIDHATVSLQVDHFLKISGKERKSICLKFKHIDLEESERVEHFRIEFILFVGLRGQTLKNGEVNIKVVDFLFWVIDILTKYILDGVATNPEGALLELRQQLHYWRELYAGGGVHGVNT